MDEFNIPLINPGEPFNLDFGGGEPEPVPVVSTDLFLLFCNDDD